MDPYSLITTPVILKSNEIRVSQGTGFYFMHEDRLFLVTAYHVIAGHPPSEKKEPLGNAISFYCHTDSERGGKVHWMEVSLQDDRGAPVWIAPPAKTHADLAVVPLKPEQYAGCNLSAVTEDWIVDPVDLSPASVVCLLGYPYGYSDRVNGLPVWKTGNLASSPGVDFEDLPMLLLDVSIFPGMSGAPALQIVRGPDGATTARLLGVFASMVERKGDRIGSDAEEKTRDRSAESLDLVQVWKAELLLDLVGSYESANPSRRANK